MSNIFEDLAWLRRPQADFSRQVAAADSFTELRNLAAYALDENQLIRLAKKLRQFLARGDDVAPLVPLSIGIISNATTKSAVPALIGTALRFGIALRVVEADYNQVAQEAFAEKSVFSGHSLTAILVALDYRGLPLRPSPGNALAAADNVRDNVAFIQSVCESLRQKSGASIILQNIAPPCEALSGSFEGRLPGTLAWLIGRINSEIDGLASNETYILDVAGLAANVGLANWHDPTLWNMAKLPFSQDYLPVYSDYICRILAARIGKSRRCLILDLDNTLWGGVIGDDGVEGILIGNGDPTGEAHLQVQRTALELRDRGIALAVSSKNEDATARLPFREHPDMLIRENHLAVFQANWTDKATNIRAVADALSLGLESMVFLDDNPAERMRVRQDLPEVSVPELPQDPALFARTLIAAGYFEAVTFSQEDQQRADFYQDNAKRAEILHQSTDLDSYLKSLRMEIHFAPFDLTGRARIVQLIAKSNQFNLTTRRYGDADVKEMESNPAYFTRQVRLTDTLGDNGMISVLICKKQPGIWEIDTWLMSCRVLGRRVEEAVLEDMVQHARNEGVGKIIGLYIPTSRNVIVADHYQKLGFKKIHEDENKTERWELDMNQYISPQLPMEFTYAV